MKRVKERGFIHQATDLAGLDRLLADARAPLKAYIGFDGTADSLHVGSLIPIMLLRWWQKCGHTPVVVLGGGTSKVGDPSGRDESRGLLDAESIGRNLRAMKKVFARFLKFGGENAPIILNNDKWLGGLNLLEFLRLVGPHFALGRMLSFDSVKTRLEREQNLTFLEFNYMVLQAYDFYHLVKAEDCAVQMGGADQWGNIVCGVELARRLAQKQTYGLTAPLAVNAAGGKMGKTAKGAVWLDADKLSPFDYWQYWRNVADADLKKCLLLFTELPPAEIERLLAASGEALNKAKKALADAATTLCHGADAAAAAAAAAKKLFEENSTAEPSHELAKELLIEGVAAFELFNRCGLCGSKSEARRLIRGGGAKINDEVVKDENLKITTSHLRGDNLLKLAAGKKRRLVVKAV